MRSAHCRAGAGVAWSSLLCAATTARAVDTTSIYEGYMSGILAIGGIMLGAIFVILVMCCSWEAATLRLQKRERRMWETAPDSTKDAAVLEKLNDDADAPRKRKAKKGGPKGGQATSPTSSNDADAISPAGRSGGQRYMQSPGADSVSAGANPYAHTEDDVVAFNSLPGKPSYF